MTVFSLCLGLASALLAPLGLAAQTTLPKQSPFAPAGGAVTAAAPNETLEFAGISSVGKKTDLIITDKAAKRRHWIGIGETVEGISVVRYDAQLEQAVIRVNGTEKVLPLRKPARVGRGPAPVQPVQTGFSVPPPAVVQTVVPPPAAIQPAPLVAAPAAATPAAAAPATPETQAKAETEARMLVSDLLEIGMAQRKAYEEAQRKAAGGESQNPANPAQPVAGGQAQPPASGQPAAPRED